MQKCVFFLNSLVTNILRYTRLISKLADCVHKISICPEFSTPKTGFHFRMPLEYLFGSDTFQHSYDLGCTKPGNRLNQKMNMVFICTYFQKTNLISLLNFKAYSLHRLINCLTENNPTIFGWTHKMIQKYRYIMRFMYVFAFTHTYKSKIYTPQSGGELTPK